MSTDPRAFLDSLDDDAPLPAAVERAARALEADDALVDEGHAAASIPSAIELVIDRKTGRVRQAGATEAEGRWVLDLKTRCERSLYVFEKVVLRRADFTPTLHKPGCDWLQTVPPWRKMMLWPREHCKTSMVGHGLPLHVQIQSATSNPYFPDEDGADIPILYITLNEKLAKGAIRVQQAAWLTNDLLRAFWPHRVWANVRRDAALWNDLEYVLPRETRVPDPSVRALGVGGAITGAHPRLVIEDDLIDINAANSDLIMQEAINCHIAYRALANRPGCLNYIIGTHWATYDLYTYIEENDPTVEIVKRSIVEDGVPIYPEGGFTDAKIADLQRDFGSLFDLLYMNNAKAPGLTDIRMEDVRSFAVADGRIVFDEDARDLALLQNASPMQRIPQVGTKGDTSMAGRPLHEVYDVVKARHEHLRLRAR